MDIEEFKMVKFPEEIYSISPIDNDNEDIKYFVQKLKSDSKVNIERYGSVPMVVEIDSWRGYFNTNDHLIYIPSMDRFTKIKGHILSYIYLYR
ncbi:hypothetical protein LCGC14_0405220 [marine sediment metagenome]|uniref:Uncharacterized protein n=1 Tax=marine sediment metagenome TaxID=412755 RepID=A0A0F9W4J9_9ZZZZ